MIISIETERLILKTLSEEHAETVLTFLVNNKEFHNEYDPEYGDDFYTLQGQQNFLKKAVEEIGSGNRLLLWIFKKEDNRLIGHVNFGCIVRGFFQSCFLGYKLDKDEINRGYMTEALESAIKYLFGEWKLHRIEANVMPWNKRSLRVLEKLGFENEGYARKYLQIRGVWEDHIHMVRLNED